MLAAAAGVLSYASLGHLAQQAGLSEHTTWLLPVVVDGLTLVGGLQVLHAVLAGLPGWYGWLLTLTGVACSVAGNVAASPDTTLARLVHAAPPVVFALSLEALFRIYRHSAAVATSSVAQAQPPAHAAGPIDERRNSATTPTVTAYPVVPVTDRETVAPVSVARPVAPVCPVSPTDDAAQPTAASGVAATVTESATAPFERVSEKPPVDAPAPAPARVFADAGTSVESEGPATTRDLVRNVLRTEPDVSAAEIARRIGKDPSTVRKLVREVKAESSASD